MAEKKLLSTLFIYLVGGVFISGWWAIAFHPLSPSPSPSIEVKQTLTIKTSSLLEELSPLQRHALQKALAGDFSTMLRLIDQWDRDAILLADKGIDGIERLLPESFIQAHLLGHILANNSPKKLRSLNCKMNLENLYDDGGSCFKIEDSFQRFLPQTYVAASFLLAIAPSHEILAIPRGLRELKQIYSPETLSKVPNDIGKIHSEQLFKQKPDLAFIAPYSHPSALEVLRNQKTPLYSIHNVNTPKEIQEALLKIGHASNHIIEAQLLSLFMDASFIAIDNRLKALQHKFTDITEPKKFIYLSQRQHYALPTTRCLAGQLMARALNLCPYLQGNIPETRSEWRIPFEQEQIIQSDPQVMIISNYQGSKQIESPALKQTQAFLSGQIFYIDEAVQESPTQYIVLAYYDLYQALASL